MKRFWLQYWFFVGVVLAVAGGLALAPVAAWGRRWHVLDVGVFLTFFVTGWTLATDQLRSQLRNGRTLVAGLASCFVLMPLLIGQAGRWLAGGNPEWALGLAILGAMPVTIISGVVLTGLARGSTPLALLLTVGCNLAGIVAIPATLRVLLGAEVNAQIPLGRMMGTLALLVLLPVGLGQAMRRRWRAWGEQRRQAFSVFNQVIVLLVIFNGVGSSGPQLRGAGADVLKLVALAAGLHVAALVVNRLVAGLLRLEPDARAAFVLCLSQKSLAVGYIVWSANFLAPPWSATGALLPCIAYHLAQLIIDTMVARRWQRQAEQREVGDAVWQDLHGAARWRF